MVIFSGIGVPIRISQLSPNVGGPELKPSLVGQSVGETVKDRGNAVAPSAQTVNQKQVVGMANGRRAGGVFQNQTPIRRMPVANGVFKKQEPIKMKPVPGSKKGSCDFNIPSFLLPDMSVTQREFEQRYLLPALRAHLTANDCRSRALTVYIDWLLYLRLRNFGV